MGSTTVATSHQPAFFQLDLVLHRERQSWMQLGNLAAKRLCVSDMCRANCVVAEILKLYIWLQKGNVTLLHLVLQCAHACYST